MADIKRADVEDFLYHEAELIDAWKLREWAACFHDQGSYIVPTLDIDPEVAVDVDPNVSLCLIADDRGLIDARVDRLENIRAHAENPRSRVNHSIANVRLGPVTDGVLEVRSNLVVHRWRHERLDTFVGLCRHRLVPVDTDPQRAPWFRILERRVVLDIESIDPMGPLSFIL
jgi:p-cumate 2,3-dioxygenase beta subunit